VQEGDAALRRATTAAAAARQLLGSVIKAREDALAAEAPKFADSPGRRQTSASAKP
jgi:hypothetical protein